MLLRESVFERSGFPVRVKKTRLTENEGFGATTPDPSPILSGLEADYFGDPADGLNSFWPFTRYAPMACCPSGETSQSANTFAVASFADACF
jgi:hypothetical protein